MRILAAIRREEKKVRKQIANLQNQLRGLERGVDVEALHGRYRPS